MHSGFQILLLMVTKLWALVQVHCSWIINPTNFFENSQFLHDHSQGLSHFQHISNPCGCAATWISIPCLHGDSTLKDLASTLSLKTLGWASRIIPCRDPFPPQSQLSAVRVSCKPNHKPEQKDKISLEKLFLLASHTHSPEDEAEKAGHPCPVFPSPCPHHSSCFLVCLLFPQPDPAAALALEPHETSQPLAMLSQLLPADLVHELPLPIHTFASGQGLSPLVIPSAPQPFMSRIQEPSTCGWELLGFVFF